VFYALNKQTENFNMVYAKDDTKPLEPLSKFVGN